MKESLMQCPKELLSVDACSVCYLGRKIKDYPDTCGNLVPYSRKILLKFCVLLIYENRVITPVSFNKTINLLNGCRTAAVLMVEWASAATRFSRSFSRSVLLVC